MTQYNTLNIKLSNLQLSNWKSEMKNNTEATLKISSNVVCDSDYEHNFLDKLLLTNTQVSKLCKAFANGSSANIKLSKTQLHKIGQSGGFLGRPLESLLKTGLPLIQNVLKPLAKSVLIPLGLTAAASATDRVIHKKMCVSGCPLDVASHATTLIISDEEINDIIKIVKSLEELGLLIKGVSETIQIEAKTKRISWNYIWHFRC